MKGQLTHQQELFAQNVAAGKSQSEAYRTAYPRSLKWNDKSVWEKASVLASNVNVSSRIAELKAAAVKRTEMTLDKTLQHMKEWIEFDPLDLMDENDCVKSMRDLAPNVRKSLSSIEVVEIFSGSGEDKHKIGELKKIKFYDKVRVADQFLKTFGAYAKNPLVDSKDLDAIREILKDIL